MFSHTDGELRSFRYMIYINILFMYVFKAMSVMCWYTIVLYIEMCTYYSCTCVFCCVYLDQVGRAHVCINECERACVYIMRMYA